MTTTQHPAVGPSERELARTTAILEPHALARALAGHHRLASAVSVFTTDRNARALLETAAAEEQLPLGSGATLRAWQLLAAVAASDISAARIIEPHLDAIEILRQAGVAAPAGATLGVFAAEHPQRQLRTSAPAHGTRQAVSGEKAWCSLAGDLSHAIVTAAIVDNADHPTGRRQALLVDLRQPGVRVGDAQGWVALGMQDVPTVDLTLADGVVGEAIGAPDWYLSRSGFAWGGIGVAACWYGGIVRLWREVVSAARRRAATRGPLDDIGAAHLGRLEAHRETAASALANAAERVDQGLAEGEAGARLALVTRRIVARSVDAALAEAGAALGPSPLAHQADYAKHVAALELYVRQEHADRDAAALGRLVFHEGDRG